jgi:hypothetical protein
MREVSRSFSGLPCPGGSVSFDRPEVNARTELRQASLAVTLVGSPRASRIASQAPAFYAGVLDLFRFLLITSFYRLPSTEVVHYLKAVHVQLLSRERE